MLCSFTLQQIHSQQTDFDVVLCRRIKKVNKRKRNTIRNMTNTHPLRRRFQKPSNVPLQKQQQQKPLRKPTKPEPEPHATNVVRRGYFASGHVLINNERQKR